MGLSENAVGLGLCMLCVAMIRKYTISCIPFSFKVKLLIGFVFVVISMF